MGKPSPLSPSSPPSSLSKEPWRVGREQDEGGGSALVENASLRLHGEIGRLFEEASDHLRQRHVSDATGWAAPRIEFVESEHDVRVRAELPMRSKDDIAVTVDDGVLTIRAAGARASADAAGGEASASDPEARPSRRHRRIGSFARSIRVPWRIDPDAVAVDFRDAVLTVALPKPSGEAAASRRLSRDKRPDGRAAPAAAAPAVPALRGARE